MGFDIKMFFRIHNQMNTQQKAKAILQSFNLFGCFIGGFTINMATYFSWLIIPLLMKERGGTSFLIGLADAITFGICGLLCPVIGVFLNKKWFPLDDVCRIGFVLQALSTIVLGLYYTTGQELLPIFFILLFQSFGLAFFWSICEYILSNECYRFEANKGISYFSMSWSLGKAIGFLLGGPMRLAFGDTFSLYFSGLIVMFGWIVFPRFLQNRNDITRKTSKNYIRHMNGELTKEQYFEEIRKEKVELKQSKKKKVQKFPYFYMLYYFNELVIHFTVYGTIAVFGNQYIDFVDEEKIILQGVNDDPGTFVSVFLGIIYFSQTITFFFLGLFNQWQYKPILNVVVQLIIAGISIGMIFLRNGWVLCVLAVPIGVISGYDLQASVVYAVNAGPHIKGKILGLSEMVGELTCALCPLFAGLLSTEFNDRRFALYQGIVLQVIGIILCIILYVIALVLQHKSGKKYRQEEDEVEFEKELSSESSSSEEAIEGKQEEDPEKKAADVEIPIDLVKKTKESDSSSISSTSDEENDDDDDKKEHGDDIDKSSVSEKKIETQTVKERKKDDVNIPEDMLKKKTLSSNSQSSTISSDSEKGKNVSNDSE